MSEPSAELARIETAKAPAPFPEAPALQPMILPADDNLTVIAQDPEQMKQAQSAMVVWANAKVAECLEEIHDLQTNVEIGRKNGWGISALQRALAKGVKRRDYYVKLKTALEAGYCIVPNFPVDVFAIRTKRKVPNQSEGAGSRRRSDPGDVSEQAQALPVGEGRYVDDRCFTTRREETRKDYQGKESKVLVEVPVRFDEEIAFPFATAKPEVLSATARAMAMKVFDELGALPSSNPHHNATLRQKGDPIIVGRIIDAARSDVYTKRFVTFLLAWFINTKDL